MGLFGRTSLVTAKMLSIGYRHKNKTKRKPLDTSESLSWFWRWGWHNVRRKGLLGRIQYGFSNSWPKALVPQDNAYSHKVSEDGPPPPPQGICVLVSLLWGWWDAYFRTGFPEPEEGLGVSGAKSPGPFWPLAGCTGPFFFGIKILFLLLNTLLGSSLFTKESVSSVSRLVL